MVGHHRERGDLDAEEPGESLQAVANPVPAMIERVAANGIDAAKEGPANNPLNTVIDPDLILDHDLRTIPPCHDPMLQNGLHCLQPVKRRPKPTHEGQRTECGIVYPVDRGQRGWPLRTFVDRGQR